MFLVYLLELKNIVMEELVKECGFDSLEDFNCLINLAYLSTEESRTAFKNWQNDDGTKQGLITLLNLQGI